MKGDSSELLRVGDIRVRRSTDPARSLARLVEADIGPGPAAEDRERILGLLDRYGAALGDRSTQPGHLTGSALVVDSAGERMLLMLHSKLGRWLQPGGHADGDHELAGVALREATEESGIEGLSVMVPAVDVDIHRIPARGSEPEHLHLDVRFVVVAPRGAVAVGNHESRELRWVTLPELLGLADEPSLLRLAERGMEAYGRFRSAL